ncbi:MAG: molybdenum cofactor guanylyltransferase [Pseudomonadota bacterium]|nr:molybdenum cofactor guanylyltransferase [Pseudomonadota bacterium]
MRLTKRPRILGAIIAGGRSSRFGSDKACAVLDGRPLLDHVLAGLGDQTDALVVCGRDVPGCVSLSDRPRPDMGPLGGLAAALHYAEQHGFDGVLTSACDTPLVPADLAERLVGGEPAMVAGQPLFGYWPAGLSAELDDYLSAATNRSVGAWAAWAGARRVRYAGEIPNINSVDDLMALRSKSRWAA